MSISVTSPHAGDDALVRYLDGESEPEERRQVDSHLAECGECAARMETLGRRSSSLAAILHRTPPEVPVFVPRQAPSPAQRRAAARWGGSGARGAWLRAAAIAALVLGVGVMASPLRARVIEWVRQGWEQLTGTAAPVAPIPTPPPAEPVATTRLRFAPPGDLLVVEAGAHPAGASLRLLRHPGEEVEVEVRNGGGILILPDRVRLLSEGTLPAEYQIHLPDGVRGVEIRRAGGGVLRLEASQIDPDAGRVVPLNESSVSGAELPAP